MRQQTHTHTFLKNGYEYFIRAPCTLGMSGAYGGQKRASDPLGLELQTVVGYHLSEGIEAQSSRIPLSCLSRHMRLFLFCFALLLVF